MRLLTSPNDLDEALRTGSMRLPGIGATIGENGDLNILFIESDERVHTRLVVRGSTLRGDDGLAAWGAILNAALREDTRTAPYRAGLIAVERYGGTLVVRQPPPSSR